MKIGTTVTLGKRSMGGRKLRKINWFEKTRHQTEKGNHKQDNIRGAIARAKPSNLYQKPEPAGFLTICHI